MLILRTLRTVPCVPVRTRKSSYDNLLPVVNSSCVPFCVLSKGIRDVHHSLGLPSSHLYN